MRSALVGAALAAMVITAPTSARADAKSLIQEAESLEQRASAAAGKGSFAEAARLEEQRADLFKDRLLPAFANDDKGKALGLLLFLEAVRSSAEYHAKAGNYRMAAERMDVVVSAHEKLGQASPLAGQLPGWRTKLREWRSKASTSPSSTPPPPAASPLTEVARALKLSEDGRSSEAIVILEATLPKVDAMSGADPRLLAKANLEAARIYEDALRPTKAEARITRAIALLELAGGNKTKELIKPLGQLGYHYVNRDEPERAAPHFMRAYDLALAESPNDVPEAILGLARVVSKRKDTKEAILLLAKARGMLARMVPNDPSLVITYMVAGINLADALEELGRFEDAAKIYDDTRDILEPMYKAAPDKVRPLWSAFITKMAWHWRKRGDFTKAEVFMRESYEHRKALFSQDSLGFANAECDLGEVYWASGDLVRSLDPISHCFDIREKNIARVLASGSEEQKRAYLGSFLVAYEKTLTAQLRAKNANARLNAVAMSQVLRTKGRILDAMTGESALIRRNASGDTKVLLDRLANVRATLAGVASSGRAPERIKQLEEESRAIEAELSEKSAAFKQATKEVSIANVKAALPSDAVLIELVAFRPLDPLYQKLSDQEPQRYVAYVLHGDSDPIAVDLGPSAPIDADVAALRPLLASPDLDPKPLAAKLYQSVLAPLEPHLRGKTNLIVSPDGALNAIPFSALRKDDHYLIEKLNFTYVTSGRDVLRWGNGSSEASEAVVVANPDYAMNGTTIPAASRFSRLHFGPLPDTEAEAAQIQGLFTNVRVLSKRDATESKVKAVTHPRVLHLATHGFFHGDKVGASVQNSRGLELEEDRNDVRTKPNPLVLSGLALAGAASLNGGDGEDGILTALEASNLDLWGTKLVVLSACQTAQGESQNGEGVYGLRRALAMAGAESLVMSLWSVDDQATSYLMRGYYKRLKDGKGRSEALRDVQLELVRSKGVNHPFFWAAFIASGDPSSVDMRHVDPPTTRDRPTSSDHDHVTVSAPSSSWGLGFHFVGLTNLRDQPDRESGAMSLTFSTPLLSRYLSGSRFGLHDAAVATGLLGLRTSTATTYSDGTDEGSFMTGFRGGYEAALGVRTGDLSVFGGAEAMYNTFVIGDAKSYGFTLPLLAIVSARVGDSTTLSARGTYGQWIVDQEVAGASLTMHFTESWLSFGFEELKMPATVGAGDSDRRLSAGRQVTTVGSLVFGGNL